MPSAVGSINPSPIKNPFARRPGTLVGGQARSRQRPRRKGLPLIKNLHLVREREWALSVVLWYKNILCVEAEREGNARPGSLWHPSCTCWSMTLAVKNDAQLGCRTCFKLINFDATCISVKVASSRVSAACLKKFPDDPFHDGHGHGRTQHITARKVALTHGLVYAKMFGAFFKEKKSKNTFLEKLQILGLTLRFWELLSSVRLSLKEKKGFVMHLKDTL